MRLVPRNEKQDKMKTKLFFLFLLLGGVGLSKAQSVSYRFTLENPSKTDLKDYMVELPFSNFKDMPLGNYLADDGKQAVSVEWSTDLRGRLSLIFPVALLKPGETKVFTITPGDTYAYPKRTYAELAHKIGGAFEGNKYLGGYSWVKPNYMKLPGTFRDHAYYIKYEGPGWESDRVAFRFYLDQRNAIDVFAKKTPGIVLPFVGVDGYQTYHNMADWGMDNMKVGKALGIGTIAAWDGKKAVRVEKRDSVESYIPADGKLRSQVKTIYYGWEVGDAKCNLHSQISIDAGSRASRMELWADRDMPLCTGIIKSPKAEFFQGESGRWAYIATFGQQSLNNDMMGLAVFYRKIHLKEVAEDELNHVVVFQPNEGYVEYYFMPTWELDWEPVVTRADFQACIDEVLTRLNKQGLCQ